MKALLFDFDGTLLDTNELIIQTFMHVLEERFPAIFAKRLHKFYRSVIKRNL